MADDHGHGDAHGHGHHPALAHHFFDMQQQHEACKLGLWLFLVTEILLFGGLFCFYAIYRAWYPEMFTGANEMLDWRLGALNTLVLIASSVTVALAIRYIQLNRKGLSAVYLLATILFAGAFLVVKYFEYSHKFHLGLLPGKFFSCTDPELLTVANPHIFFGAYFAMTGLHGLHVLGGMAFLSWVLWRVMQGAYGSTYYTPVELGGLYWHLVDLIWIYLFPLLYLIG